jgi:hypothetical protein
VRDLRCREVLAAAAAVVIDGAAAGDGSGGMQYASASDNRRARRSVTRRCCDGWPHRVAPEQWCNEGQTVEQIKVENACDMCCGWRDGKSEMVEREAGSRCNSRAVLRSRNHEYWVCSSLIPRRCSTDV